MKAKKRRAYFEDVRLGDTLISRPVRLSRRMREGHIKLYKEDWDEDEAAAARQVGVMPAPSVLAKAAGVVGVSGWMRIHRLVDVKYDARFLRPLKVGDYIVVTVTVTAKRQHRKRNRNFGWVWVRQVIARADGKPCYIRKAMYAVLKKPLESS